MIIKTVIITSLIIVFNACGGKMDMDNLEKECQ